jgi:hypothetical protein
LEAKLSLKDGLSKLDDLHAFSLFSGFIILGYRQKIMGKWGKMKFFKVFEVEQKWTISTDGFKSVHTNFSFICFFLSLFYTFI